VTVAVLNLLMSGENIEATNSGCGSGGSGLSGEGGGGEARPGATGMVWQMVLVPLVVASEEEHSVLDLVEDLGGRSHLFDCICSIGLLIGQSSFLYYFLCLS
jgi:hypothetical protein